MILIVILVSFLVAFLRGGWPRSDVRLRHLWAAPVALILQLAARYVAGSVANLVLIAVSYGLLVFVLVRNSQMQSLRILLLGVILNFAVILANDGRIPVDVEQAARLGLPVAPLLEGTDAKHVAMQSGSYLGFLGDVIPVTFPIAKLISIGDISIMVGTFTLIQEFMGKRLVAGAPEN